MQETNIKGFNNDSFRILVEDLLHDAFYLDGRRNRGVITTIRQYTEVIVRKILNYSEAERFTLGQNAVRDALEEASDKNELLLQAINNIHKLGNQTTHTQYLQEVTQEDVNIAINSLFDLYAYLFVSYFKKYRFGKNLEIVSVFSILPPIIRYITLRELYDSDKENVTIIDKYSLSILKAFDENKALTWLKERENTLRNMPSVTLEAKEGLSNKFGPAFANEVYNNAPNMFDVCSKRVMDVNDTIQTQGRLYDDFESAMALYKEKGKVKGSDLEIAEFNSLMEFSYLGRQAIKNKKLENIESYITFD